MSIQTSIRDELTEAMKAKTEPKLTVLRGLVSAFTNELVAKGRKPNEELSEEEALAVIQRAVKQRKDSIDQYTKGGREDLAAQEKTELKVLEAYLPEMMSRDEIEKVAQAKKEELGVSEKKDMGRLMGAVMGDLKGKADGGDVKAVVESLLS